MWNDLCIYFYNYSNIEDLLNLPDFSGGKITSVSIDYLQYLID